VTPSARLSGDKQAHLCLVAQHVDCPTFVAAREARAARGVPPLVDRRPLARTTPTVIEPARARFRLDLGGNARRIGQGGVALLMLVAIVAVVLARTGPSQPGAAGTPGPSEPAGSVSIATPGTSLQPSSSGIGASATAPTPSPSPRSSATPSPTSTATRPPATPTPTPAPTPARTSTPAPTPLGSGSYVTYTVKSGDTLSAIAAKYKTTVQAILDANGIASTAFLQIGQVLRIPH
jgi:LysM repeat protein